MIGFTSYYTLVQIRPSDLGHLLHPDAGMAFRAGVHVLWHLHHARVHEEEVWKAADPHVPVRVGLASLRLYQDLGEWYI